MWIDTQAKTQIKEPFWYFGHPISVFDTSVIYKSIKMACYSSKKCELLWQISTKTKQNKKTGFMLWSNLHVKMSGKSHVTQFSQNRVGQSVAVTGLMWQLQGQCFNYRVIRGLTGNLPCAPCKIATSHSTSWNCLMWLSRESCMWRYNCGIKQKQIFNFVGKQKIDHLQTELNTINGALTRNTISFTIFSQCLKKILI